MHLCVGGGDAQAHAHLETASCRERRDAEGPSGGRSTVLYNGGFHKLTGCEFGVETMKTAWSDKKSNELLVVKHGELSKHMCPREYQYLAVTAHEYGCVR